MATVTRENIGVLNEKIVVKVAKDDYLPSFQKAIKDYSKKANIPGFRKGMVPVGMVKKMYGSSVFADEVIKSVEKGLSEYMTTEKLQIFAQPLPLPENDSPKLDMDQPAEYQFSFEVGLKPEFSIADLGAAQLTRYKVEVSEEVIKKELEGLLDRASKLIDAETITSGENVIDVAVAESDADGKVNEEVKTTTASLDVKNFTEEYRSQLMNKKAGDVLTIKLLNAFEESDKALILTSLKLAEETEENADKFFNLVITKVSLLEKATLNQEFFDQVFPGKDITTEDGAKELIKNEIDAQWEAQSRNQLFDQIYHELLKHTQITFPEDFLKRWMLNGTEKAKTQEEVENEFPAFSNQLKWTLITDKLVQDNSIEVLPDDLHNFAKNQLLSYMGGSNINIDQPWVNDYVERMMKDKKFVEDSYHRIQTDKIFSWAETQVNATEATISDDEFKKMLEGHKHEH